jgi:hypothetical protein
MKLLEFYYVNYKNELHRYTVIPFGVEFGEYKLAGGPPVWKLKCLVLLRDGIMRNNIRSFVLMKMMSTTEVSFETR